MDAAVSRAVIVGHLTLTVPVIAAILLVPFLGLRMFGPSLFVYYVLAGIALGWQRHEAALPSWKRWLARSGVQDEKVELLVRRTGLAWPGEATIGPFAFHTTAAAVCGVHLGPWLLSRWFVWILPLTGRSIHIPTGDDYLQHFELASIVPAFIVGYILSRYFRRLATCAWLLPTLVLAYKLLTFAEPYQSILAPHPSTRFSYFFVIQRSMPTFTAGFGGVDPVRGAQQMSVVAPFYGGLAYSIGALAAKHNVVEKFFGPPPQPESQVTLPEKTTEEYEAEKTAHELD